PIESLEKYLKQNLFLQTNQKLYRILEDYIFQQTSLRSILSEYKNSGESKDDNNGKKLYNRIDTELRNRNKTRGDIIELLIKHIETNESESLNKITQFLNNKLR